MTVATTAEASATTSAGTPQPTCPPNPPRDSLPGGNVLGFNLWSNKDSNGNAFDSDFTVKSLTLGSGLGTETYYNQVMNVNNSGRLSHKANGRVPS